MRKTSLIIILICFKSILIGQNKLDSIKEKDYLSKIEFTTYNKTIRVADSLREIYFKHRFFIKENDTVYSDGGSSIIKIYQKALTFKKGEQYPIDKMNEIYTLMDEDLAKELERQIQKIIQAGDKNFAARNFEKAKELYTRVINIKGKNEYCENKILEIENILKSK